MVKGMDIEKKVIKMLEALGSLKPGMAQVSVRHDDSCPALKTDLLRDCTCEPDIQVMMPDA